MVRDERRAQPEHLPDVADAVLAVAEEGDDPGAVRLCDGLQGDQEIGIRASEDDGWAGWASMDVILTSVSTTTV